MTNKFYKITAQNGVVFYKNKMLEQVDFINHAFSTRIGGVSRNAYTSLNLGVNTPDEEQAVLQNYRLFSEAIEIDLDTFVLSNQVHDDKIKIATSADCGKGVLKESDIKGIDALITQDSGVALSTFYADCTPLLMVDPKKHVIASVHSGWRGTLLKIAQKTALKMQDTFGCAASDILCAIGPSIKQCHFEVGEEVYRQFQEVFGKRAEENTVCKNDKFYINTDRLNVMALTDIGILKENISLCPDCTFCNNDTLYSHRGDGGKTGRMCAVIALK